MPLRAEIDVRRLDVAVDEPGLPQIEQRAAKIHRQIDRAKARHGVVIEIIDQRFAVLCEQIHIVADAVFLRRDLIAAEAVEIRA